MIRFIISLFDIVLWLFGAILDGISSFVVAATPSRRSRGYDADFVPAGKLLEKGEKGFCLTGTESMTIKDSFSHALILGGSSSGKSSIILIPSILNMAGASSLVVHDPSSELYFATASALHAQGYDIKRLNYSTPSASEQYNPLRRIVSASDIGKISKLMVHASLGAGKDPFWNLAAENVISLFIKYVTAYLPEHDRTMKEVLALINRFAAEPDDIDKLIVATGDAGLLNEYYGLVASGGGKLLESVIATARAALSIFSDPGIQQVTAGDSISFEEFRNGKIVLYINNSVADMRYYSAISSIFFEQFFGSIMSALPKKEDRPIFFLIDEASSLYLNILPTAISNLRKYRSGLQLVYQHYSQIIDLFGQAQARNIAANSYAKVYMPGVPHETAQELEAILGRYEYVDDDGANKVRHLLTADEIRTLKDAIILLGNYPPIRATLTPYYKQPRLKRLASLPPYTP